MPAVSAVSPWGQAARTRKTGVSPRNRLSAATAVPTPSSPTVAASVSSMGQGPVTTRAPARCTALLCGCAAMASAAALRAERTHSALGASSSEPAR